MTPSIRRCSWFLPALAAAFLFALLILGFALHPKAFVGLRPVSNLVNTPNFFSAVVAVLAGIVSLAEEPGRAHCSASSFR
ncbi:hypothetical protein QFZ76_000541 [Streptomyces sp. V4I2]|nr:hypothetical protein [Streptomyces sp. V4I2]